ncbi:MAG: S8 family serine peptidase [Nitrososphaerota archaeon]|nr:S8 family serine peptidase [Candidatus Calditenuaceae archaeon]MDW8073956.1 S8 family serine peptidase [Nitrososphaerota archaeon]
MSLRQALDAVRLLDRAGGGEGCRVAIIDTGSAEDAPLKGHVNLTGKSLADTEAHGEYVHRLIHKILPEAEIYMVKVPNPVPDYVFITAMHEAMKWRPHAVNISMGSEIATDGGDPVSIYADRLAAVSVVVCAAGNGGPRPLSVGSPACSRESLAVGAVNLRLRPWSSSSRGPTLDGRFKPDIVAPTGYFFEEFETRLTGTSFSTPLATAAAALAASLLPRPRLIKRLLQLTAQPIQVSLVNLAFIRGVQPTARPAVNKLLRALMVTADPRNIVGMGLLNAGDAIKEASQLAPRS